MKTKRFNKPLTLNKTTIVNLNIENMNQLRAGGVSDGSDCWSICETECILKCAAPNTEPPLCTLGTCDFECITETSRNC